MWGSGVRARATYPVAPARAPLVPLPLVRLVICVESPPRWRLPVPATWNPPVADVTVIAGLAVMACPGPSRQAA